MELTEQEAHCLARLLQGALFNENILTGCDYCKNRCYENRCDIFFLVRKRLSEATDVDLKPEQYAELPHSDFPYGIFLKNASEKTKAWYRVKFNQLLGDI